LSLWQAILGNLVAVKDRGTYQTWFSISWGLACASGMVVGGLIIDSWGWKWIFYINLPIGGICLAIGWYYLQLPFTPRYVPFDWLGSTLVAASTILLMIGLTVAGEKADWTSASVQLSLWGGLLGYALFVYVEYKAVAPIMPGNILRRRNIWVSCIAIFFQGSTDLVVTGFATFLQMVQLYSATYAGLLTLPYVAVNGLANAGAGWIMANTSHVYKIPFVRLFLHLPAHFLCICSVFGAHIHIWWCK
jgi:MFS family permease